MKLDKQGQVDFVMLFAIIAGSMILLLAIYGAIKAGTTMQTTNQAELAKSIQIITDPMQAGFAEASTATISMKQNITISNDCSTDDGFGVNKISVEIPSPAGIQNQMPTSPVKISITNKYIFSDLTPGKIFYVFSQPFNSPFRVADVLIVSSQDYCFINPPDSISAEVFGLHVKNIGIKNTFNNTCAIDAKTVCFGPSNCDISVVGECNKAGCDTAFDYGYVKKRSDQLDYSGNLLFAAIFSDKDLYDCNVQRLMFRLSDIADLLSQKADRMNARGCNVLMKPDMEALLSLTQNATSDSLQGIYDFSQSIQIKEDNEECKLW